MTMTPERYARVKEIFQAIENLPSDERQERLENACVGDQELFDSVWKLLDHHDPDAAVREGRTVVQDRDQQTIINDRNVQARLQPDRKSVFGWVSRYPHIAGYVSLALVSTVFATVIAAVVGDRSEDYVVAMQRQALQTGAEQTVAAIEQWARTCKMQSRAWGQDSNLLRIVSSYLQLVNSGADDSAAVEALKATPLADELRSKVEQLVGGDAKYVLWNGAGLTLASWQQNMADVGNHLPPESMAELSRAMLGQSVLQFPTRLSSTTEGFEPEPDVPLMWITFPILDEQARPIAVMLLRDFGMREQFQSFFDQVRVGNDADVFGLDEEGLLITESRHSKKLIDLELVTDKGTTARLRAADPGGDLSSGFDPRRSRQTLPLTEAAARVTVGESAAMMEGYRDVQGKRVVGAWQWIDEFKIGVVCERSYDDALSVLRWIRLSLIALTLLPLGAFGLGLLFSRAGRHANEEAGGASMAGAYELLEKIGEGGMGYVYRARHSLLKRASAVKVLRPDRLTAVDVGRFDREVKLAAQLSSPNTIQIFDYGRTDDGLIYFAMEFLDGLSLDAVVKRSGALSAGRTIHFLIQLCNSVEEAHTAGLIHRDIKPQNIMITRRGNQADWLILFDFGLAKSVDPKVSEFRTRERIWAGTPMFMSPERVRTPGGVDPRMDIYAIGAVGYLMLTGKEPFTNANTEMLFDQVLNTMPSSPTEAGAPDSFAQLDALVLKCLAKEPDDRPESAATLRRRLEQLAVKYPWSSAEADQWWKKNSR